MKNPALALVERSQAGSEDGSVLADLILVLDLPERLERIEVRAVVTACRRGLEEKRERRTFRASPLPLSNKKHAMQSKNV